MKTNPQTIFRKQETLAKNLFCLLSISVIILLAIIACILNDHNTQVATQTNQQVQTTKASN